MTETLSTTEELLADLASKINNLNNAVTPPVEIIKLLANTFEAAAVAMEVEKGGGSLLYAAIRLTEIAESSTTPGATAQKWGTGICGGIFEEPDEATARTNALRFETTLFSQDKTTGQWIQAA